MLNYPVATTRAEKLEMIEVLKSRLLSVFGDQILAIGIYGSIALERDEPYSDIEMHVLTEEGVHLANSEFVYNKFKIEITLNDPDSFFREARKIDDCWAITAGSFIHIQPVYDPQHFFERVKKMPFESLNSSRERVMNGFMVWEPYETIAKIRSNYCNGNLNYLPLGANDLLWQTAKLIGLANRRYYSTRARTFEESLDMKSIPYGYKELLQVSVAGQMHDKKRVYDLCEELWTGLNSWYEEMGLDYRLRELPI